MNSDRENVIGIVGGMGPEAGVALYKRILSNTPAGSDQEHLSVMLMSFPGHIVDRTAFLEGVTHINPAYNVVKIIEKLETAGAGIIGIACNTSHAPEIFDVIMEELDRKNSSVTLVNMPLETCLYIKDKYPFVRRVGVMATNGTCKSGVYENLLRRLGYDLVIPDSEFQNDFIHRIIYDPWFGIKANPNCITPEAKLLIERSICFFRERNTDAIILGCTELSLGINKNVVDGLLIVDSMEVLALALIREATSRIEAIIKMKDL